MAKKKSPHGKKKGKKGPVVVEEKALDRFAGSSDEDDEHDGNHDTKEVQVNQDEPRVLHVEHDADEESGNEEEQDHARGRQEKNKSTSEKPFVTNTEAMVEEETEPGEKMAGAMARILGTFSTATTTTAATTKTASSVVLAKTVTPLQRLQQQEKDKEKALKQKRQANKERNLASLHIPLSVATTNTIGEGRHSITKELEQERFHRRVATRGVVALFNAIAQHQNVTEVSPVCQHRILLF